MTTFSRPGSGEEGGTGDVTTAQLNDSLDALEAEIAANFAPLTHNHAATDINSGTLNVARLPTGIDAANLHDGSVSSTEFGYLNGVTSAIQTQLTAKLAAPTGTTNNVLRWNGTTLVNSAITDDGTSVNSVRKVGIGASVFVPGAMLGVRATTGNIAWFGYDATNGLAVQSTSGGAVSLLATSLKLATAALTQHTTDGVDSTLTLYNNLSAGRYLRLTGNSGGGIVNSVSGTGSALDIQCNGNTMYRHIFFGGYKMAFFGVAPVERQLVPMGSTADQIITALQNLGLFRQT